MKNHLETITSTLARVIQGESTPSVKTQEFIDLVTALKAVASPAHIDEPNTRLVHQQIGLRALYLLLDHIGASMQSERALTMMRDNGEKPC